MSKLFKIIGAMSFFTTVFTVAAAIDSINIVLTVTCGVFGLAAGLAFIALGNVVERISLLEDILLEERDIRRQHEDEEVDKGKLEVTAERVAPIKKGAKAQLNEILSATEKAGNTPTSTRVTCESCKKIYNLALGRCPFCQTKSKTIKE